MNTELDALEHQLGRLRPARLPAEARQRIRGEMQHPRHGRRTVLWLLGHRAGFPVALAGALSLAVAVGLWWLPRSPRPAPPVDQRALATSNALMPSLAFLEAKLAVVSPMGINTVAALCSPSVLTNVEIRR
jgi:hypothetical protein